MRDPLGAFLGSIASPETGRQYRSKLDLFLTAIGMEGSLEEKARSFVDKAKEDKDWALDMAARFMAYHKMRCDNKEITAGTLRNYYKPIKVFCETNDVVINWKRITRGLPKSRKFAQDRAPTTEEIRKLVEYPDRRMRGIVYLMSSSGVRVGAWDYLKWGHIEPIYDDQKQVIAGRMLVYAGEPEQYQTFITPEAYNYLKEWMQFREQHGEKVGPNSWVMRDTFERNLATNQASRASQRTQTTEIIRNTSDAQTSLDIPRGLGRIRGRTRIQILSWIQKEIQDTMRACRDEAPKHRMSAWTRHGNSGVRILQAY